MNKQGIGKIDWCDYSWNPVTGCYNGCSYCYARRIAERFEEREYIQMFFQQIYINHQKQSKFPRGFSPTFHPHRLEEPQKEKKPSKIFVCSMADLFGDWVPDAWIESVFDACRKAPQHTYMFLTKNGERMADAIQQFGDESNWWFGQTITRDIDDYSYLETPNRFTSFEPILTSLYADKETTFDEWLIFGAMTKNGRNVKEYEPKWEWIEDLVIEARRQGIPIFMKQSMKGIVPDEQFTQEYPKGMR